MARPAACECHSGFTCGACCARAKPYFFTPRTSREIVADASRAAPARVTVTFDGDEFRVPGPKGTEAQAYYTGDRGDAASTARHIFGEDVVIRFRRVDIHPGA